MSRKILAAALLGCMAAGAAEAAVVDAQHDLTYVFDLSGDGDVEFNLSSWHCVVTCPGNDSLMLDSGGTFKVNYGTTIGGSELGSRQFKNGLTKGLNTLGGAFVTSPVLSVAAAIDTLYATIVHVDDDFAVDHFRLAIGAFGDGNDRVGVLYMPEVPLPASMPLLLAGLAAVAALARRRAA